MHAAGGDVADSDDDPIQHREEIVGSQKMKGRPKPAFSTINSIGNYFLGAIASLAALATRNFTTVFALI